MKKQVGVHTPTKEEFIKVVQKCFDNGVYWHSGYKNINENYWNTYKDQTCIDVCCDGDYIFFDRKEWYQENYPIIPIISAQEFLGEKKGTKVKWWCGGETGTGTLIGESIDGDYCVIRDDDDNDDGWEWCEHQKYNLKNPEEAPPTGTPHCYWVDKIEPYKEKLNTIPEQNKGKGKIMSIIKNIFRTKEQKALTHYNIINGDGGLTSDGQDEFLDYLWETMTEERKDFTAKVVKEYDEEKK
ncbi:MAG: hypothetical protein WC437_04755 [Patescibacteria group bacterium]